MTLPPDDDRDIRRTGNRRDSDDPVERPQFDDPAFRSDADPEEDPEDDEDYLDPGEGDEYDDEYDDSDDEYEEEFAEPGFTPEAREGGATGGRAEPPLFAPVVFDDEESGRRRFGGRRGQGSRGDRGEGGDRGDRGGGTPRGAAGRGRYESDAGLLRVLALIGVLGVIILALVLPFSPISVLGDGDSTETAQGISARVSDEMPPLPEGLVALSDLYEIDVEEGVTGPLSVAVELTEDSGDGSNLAYYSWDGSTWSRIGSVQVAGDGGSVTGAIPAESASIAVLRRTALAHSMAMIVGPGETPDPDGLSSASLVVVTAATLAEDGTLEADAAALRSAQQVAGDRPVYLGVTGDVAESDVVGAGAADHAAAILAVAEEQEAAGVYLEYDGVSDAAAFTTFVTDLAEQLHAAQRQLVVAVPATGDGYDWPGLVTVVDQLWVEAPISPVEYYATVESLLSERGVEDTSKVSVILDRRSAMVEGGEPARPIGLIEGLTVASTIDFNVDAIGPGSPVTLRTAYLGGGPEQQLHWDDEANAVAFSYTQDGVDSTVWFTNEYSFGFALQAASLGGFSGVAIRSAAAGGSHPSVWEPVAQFVEEGTVDLLRPYGPYLTPCWESPEGTVEGQPQCWTTETDTTAVVWRAPEDEGAYTVRLVVSEGTTFVGQEVVLRVGDTPDEEATEEPTEEATEEPTETATEEPTETPTEEATEEPTETATEEATEEPTETATEEPTETATEEPTSTEEPTETSAPTEEEGPAGPGGNE